VLALNVADDTIFEEGQTFTILDANQDMAGAFDGFEGFDLNGDLAFTLTEDTVNDTLTLQVVTDEVAQIDGSIEMANTKVASITPSSLMPDLERADWRPGSTVFEDVFKPAQLPLNQVVGLPFIIGPYGFVAIYDDPSVSDESTREAYVLWQNAVNQSYERADRRNNPDAPNDQPMQRCIEREFKFSIATLREDGIAILEGDAEPFNTWDVSDARQALCASLDWAESSFMSSQMDQTANTMGRESSYLNYSYVAPYDRSDTLSLTTSDNAWVGAEPNDIVNSRDISRVQRITEAHEEARGARAPDESTAKFLDGETGSSAINAALLDLVLVNDVQLFDAVPAATRDDQSDTLSLTTSDNAWVGAEPNDIVNSRDISRVQRITEAHEEARGARAPDESTTKFLDGETGSSATGDASASKVGWVVSVVGTGVPDLPPSPQGVENINYSDEETDAALQFDIEGALSALRTGLNEPGLADWPDADGTEPPTLKSEIGDWLDHMVSSEEWVMSDTEALHDPSSRQDPQSNSVGAEQTGSSSAAIGRSTDWFDLVNRELQLPEDAPLSLDA